MSQYSHSYFPCFLFHSPFLRRPPLGLAAFSVEGAAGVERAGRGAVIVPLRAWVAFSLLHQRQDTGHGFSPRPSDWESGCLSALEKIWVTFDM